METASHWRRLKEILILQISRTESTNDELDSLKIDGYWGMHLLYVSGKQFVLDFFGKMG